MMLKICFQFLLMATLFSCSSEIVEKKRELKVTVDKLNSLRESRGFRSDTDCIEYLIMDKPYFDRIISLEREIDNYYGRDERKLSEYLFYYDQAKINGYSNSRTGFFGVNAYFANMAKRKYYILDKYKL